MFKHGLITFSGMLLYHLPSILIEIVALTYQSILLHLIATFLWLLATIAVPGFMTHYCYAFDISEIFNPAKALRRVKEGGMLYWKAWLIALCALALSFTGLLFFGIGFLVTSVWFWQIAGFSFATVFSQKFNLKL